VTARRAPPAPGWLSYRDAARRLGIGATSVGRLAVTRGWPRWRQGRWAYVREIDVASMLPPAAPRIGTDDSRPVPPSGLDTTSP